MAWNDAQEIVVFGNGQAYTAAIGTTLPAKGSSPTAALAGGFSGLGYWKEEEGCKFTIAKTIAETRAAQAQQAVRRELTQLDAKVEFVCLQWNEVTVPATFGGTVDVVGGIATYTPPAAGAALGEFSLVVDIQDGAKNYRWVFPRGTNGPTVESTFVRTEAGVLPLEYDALAPATGGDPFYWMSDDAAFAAGS